MLETTTSVDTKTSTKTKTIVLAAVFLATAGILYLAGFIMGANKINEKLITKNKELSTVKQQLTSQQTTNKETDSSDAYKYTCDKNLDELLIINEMGKKTCHGINQLASMEDFSQIFFNKEIKKIFPTHGIDPVSDKSQYEKARQNFWEPFQTHFNLRINHFTDSDDLKIDCSKGSIMKVISPDKKETCYTWDELKDNTKIESILFDSRYAKIIAPSNDDPDFRVTWLETLRRMFREWGLIFNGHGGSGGSGNNPNGACEDFSMAFECKYCGESCMTMGCVSDLCPGGSEIQCCPQGGGYVPPPGGGDVPGYQNYCDYEMPGYTCQECGVGSDQVDCGYCVTGLCSGGSDFRCCPN